MVQALTPRMQELQRKRVMEENLHRVLMDIRAGRVTGLCIFGLTKDGKYSQAICLQADQRETAANAMNEVCTQLIEELMTPTKTIIMQ